MTFSVLPHRDRLGVKAGRLWIDNQWMAASDDGSLPHIHPSTNEEVTRFAAATAADVDRAVRTARKAFDEGPWPRMRARERRHVLRRYVDLLERHSDELSNLQTLDNGMPITWSLVYRASGQYAADLFDHFTGWIDKINGEVYPQFTADNNLQFLSLREPVGVVAGIIPWNAPLLQFTNKLAPALATGCCMIMKPSENASLTALRLAELLTEIDLPPGVFQLLTGGPATGDALMRHPGVDKVTFTGSRAVGGQILAASGRDIKRVTLELGGKSAAIIFPDCVSIESASTQAMAMVSMFLSGQVCSTTSRVLVHKSIYEQFAGFAAQQVKAVRFGDPFDKATTSSPLINKRQVEKVLGYIGKGSAEGARLAFGGDRPTDPQLAAGNWVNPALFLDVAPTATIAHEEIFGPVLAATPFEDEEEAIRLANDSEYGLSAGLYTTNIGRALRVAKALRTGTVGVNGYTFMPNSPFGGYKASGVGREGGWPAIEAFTEVKTIMINLSV